MAKGIWIYAEHAEGKLRKVSLEILSEARRLADKAGEGVAAVLLGSGVAGLAQTLGYYGADKVYLAEHDILKDYRVEPYSKVIADLISQNQPSIFLLGANINGRDLAPRGAARVKTGLAGGFATLCINDQGLLQIKEIVKDVSGLVVLTEADTIRFGGRGMKGAEKFAILEELAALLQAPVG